MVNILVILTLLAGLSSAQEIAQTPNASVAKDLLTTVRADRSLGFFDSAITSSGMAKMLNEKGPFTVFALSDHAFANLSKDDLGTLLANPSVMHVLLAHYIVRGAITKDDTASLLSAKTLAGVDLRTDVRSEGTYVNGAKLSQSEIRCTNGMIHVLDSLDPGLVHDAVALAIASRRGK
jgi:uncharacterized surface protein with fasciclin (FAS1) repeats